MNERARRLRDEQYTRQHEVLEMLANVGRATPRSLYSRDDTDIHPSRCYSALRKLVDRGYARKIDKGLYEVTDAGAERAEQLREADLDKSFDDSSDDSGDDLDADPEEFEFADEGGYDR